MIKFALRSFIIAIGLTVTPLHAQSTKDAFVDIKGSAFKKEFDHLAVMPVIAAPALGMPDEIGELIMGEVLKKFKKSKITVLPPQQVKSIQDHFTGLYPETAIKASSTVVLEHTVRELYFRHPVDGLVSIQVVPVAAPFVDDKAQWGGTSQKIKHKGDGLFGAILGTNYGGNVGASAIRIVISDRKGMPVYNWLGGIEVLMQRNGDQLEVLPAADLWQSRKRVLKAIKYALKPI
ncbi:MAG: hypothetical protein KJP04_02150 [Arenicella sp.]|nr:hypothetical protein [Arenicella sp.]